MSRLKETSFWAAACQCLFGSAHTRWHARSCPCMLCCPCRGCQSTRLALAFIKCTLLELCFGFFLLPIYLDSYYLLSSDEVTDSYFTSFWSILLFVGYPCFDFILIYYLFCFVSLFSYIISYIIILFWLAFASPPPRRALRIKNLLPIWRVVYQCSNDRPLPPPVSSIMTYYHHRPPPTTYRLLSQSSQSSLCRRQWASRSMLRGWSQAPAPPTKTRQRGISRIGAVRCSMYDKIRYLASYKTQHIGVAAARPPCPSPTRLGHHLLLIRDSKSTSHQLIMGLGSIAPCMSHAIHN